jgi:hypothetical protein
MQNLPPPPNKTPLDDKQGLFGHTWAAWFSLLRDAVLAKSGKGDPGPKGDKGDSITGPPGPQGPQGDTGSLGKHNVTVGTLPKSSTDTTFNDSILSQTDNKLIFVVEPPLFADNDAAVSSGLATGTVFRKGQQSEAAFLDVANGDITAAIYQAVITESGENYPIIQDTIVNPDIPKQTVYQGTI